MLIYRFIPRHHDELNIEIGDPIYVQKEAEDLWCEGKSIYVVKANLSIYGVKVNLSIYGVKVNQSIHISFYTYISIYIYLYTYVLFSF